MSSPFISVIVIAYGRRQFIKRAIKSVVDQKIDRQRFEIIVTKDYEDAEIDSFAEQSGAKLLVHGGRSIGGRLSYALGQAKGEVITFLEDDDLYEENRLSRINEIFSSDDALGFYHNSESFMDENEQAIASPRGWDPAHGISLLGNLSFRPSELGQCDAYKIMHLYIGFNISSIAIRRKILEERLQLMKTLESDPDDFLFFSALNSDHKMLAEDKKLTKYRVHSGNASTLIGITSASSNRSNYRGNQLEAYQVMNGSFAHSLNPAATTAFGYSMNYIRLLSLFTTRGSSRKSMFPTALGQMNYSIRYLLCSSPSPVIRTGKLGLMYNMRLALLAFLFLLSPTIARAVYSYIYMG